MPEEPRPRPRSDTVRNRAALIDAGRRVFESEGIDAPLEAVAAAAGLSRTSLHRHFSSRGELLAAIWSADVDETEADVRRFADRPDAFIGVFDGILRQQVDRRSLHPDAVALESPEIIELGERFIAVVERAIAVSRAAGVLRSGLPATSPLRAVQMAITAIWSVPDRAERAEVAAEVRALLLPGLLEPDWAAAHPEVLDGGQAFASR